MYQVVVSQIREEPETGIELISNYVWGTYKTKFWANIWARDITEGLQEIGNEFAYVEKCKGGGVA